jgi:glucose dehydrogenase
MTKPFFEPQLSYRFAGWSTIVSGILGILGFAALIIAVLTRTSWEITPQVWFLFNVHNVLVILQFLLMIPLTIALYNLSQKQSRRMSR